MSCPRDQFPQSIAAYVVAQGGEAFAHGRQGYFHIRLPGFCTYGVHAVVGQQRMGQAAQVRPPTFRQQRAPEAEALCGSGICQTPRADGPSGSRHQVAGSRGFT